MKKAILCIAVSFLVPASCASQATAIVIVQTNDLVTIGNSMRKDGKVQGLPAKMSLISCVS